MRMNEETWEQINLSQWMEEQIWMETRGLINKNQCMAELFKGRYNCQLVHVCTKVFVYITKWISLYLEQFYHWYHWWSWIWLSQPLHLPGFWPVLRLSRMSVKQLEDRQVLLQKRNSQRNSISLRILAVIHKNIKKLLGVYMISPKHNNI